MGKSYRRNDEYGNKYRGFRRNIDKSNKKQKNSRERYDVNDARWDYQNAESFRWLVLKPW